MVIILLIMSFLRAITAAPIQCGNTTTYCPESGVCCLAKYSPTQFGCQLPTQFGSQFTFPPSPTASCCMPGPELPPSTTLPNCLVIGDSVSIGYVGVAAKNISQLALLQHGPWDVSDGGAGATIVGQTCLDNFMRTQAQQEVAWDVILFNFGLHDMDNSTSGEATYKKQLTNITNRLLATTSKLIYATTTPYMPYASIGNNVVAELNEIARGIMTPHSDRIEILDLHKVVTDHCGNNYTTCDWCRKTPCSYHYNDVGETAQGLAVATKFRTMLK
tara:strand:+ start:217 stop:1038 length:822 start_codon:yes stop_codon:yes gene_type:complete